MAIRSKIINYSNIKNITQSSQVTPVKANNDDTGRSELKSCQEENKDYDLVKELHNRLSCIQEGLELILNNDKPTSNDGTKDSGIDAGDGRKIITPNQRSNSSNSLCNESKPPIIIAVTEKDILESLQRSHLQYDRSGEEHYNIISALHKSMRGSDENAAIYWLCRMLKGGEQPTYIARRLIRFASEDIGALKDSYNII